MKIGKITSLMNPLVRKVSNIRDRKSEFRGDMFVAEGPHILETAVRAESIVKQVFFTQDFREKHDGRRLLGDLSVLRPEIFEVSEQVFAKLSDTETPQGVLAVISQPIAKIEALRFKDIPFLAVSDGIQDPGNIGSLIRTADGAGADAVIVLPGSCDPFMPKALRASAGSVLNIPVIITDRAKFVEWARGKKIQILSASANSESSIYETDLKLPIAVIFGNEGNGISPELEKASQGILSVPIFGKAESLNVAISAALCLYEIRRQRVVG